MIVKQLMNSQKGKRIRLEAMWPGINPRLHWDDSSTPSDAGQCLLHLESVTNSLFQNVQACVCVYVCVRACMCVDILKYI